MGTKIISSPVYYGNLQTFYDVNGKRKQITSHNNGTSLLFELFCRALLGQSTTGYTANYLRLVEKSSTGTSNITKYDIVLSGRALQEITSDTNETTYEAIFTASFVKENMQTSPSIDNPVCEAQILSTTHEALAHTQLPDEVVNAIRDLKFGVSLVFEWHMGIKNETTNTESENS